MKNTFYLATSQNLIAANLSGATPINHIHIDNPSGSWLRIRPTLDFVPPYTDGFELDLPGCVSVDVVWSNSPSGSVSNTATMPLLGRVTVVISDEAVGNDPGHTSGAGHQVGDEPLTTQAILVIGVNEAGVAGTLYNNPSPTEALVVTQVELSAFGSGLRAVRDQIIGNVGWGGVPPPNVIAVVAIGPERPSDFPLINPNAARVGAGFDIEYSLQTASGGGASDVTLSAVFYRVIT